MRRRRLIKVLINLRLQLPALKLGHILGPLDRVDFIRVRRGEDDVDLLEAAALGLGEEEPDAGEEEDAVEDGEDDVRLVAEVGEGRRRDHDDEEVAEPVAAG